MDGLCRAVQGYPNFGAPKLACVVFFIIFVHNWHFVTKLKSVITGVAFVCFLNK